MVWEPYASSADETSGSEGGVVLADETYEDAARITLEQDTSRHVPAAITCGIYGWMMHTRFFSDIADARRAYDDMKADLASIVDRIPLQTDEDRKPRMSETMKAIEVFMEKYP